MGRCLAPLALGAPPKVWRLGLFVPKPSSRVSTLGNPVPNLGFSVR